MEFLALCTLVKKKIKFVFLFHYNQCIFNGLLHPIKNETKSTHNRPKQKQRIPRLLYGSQSLSTYDVAPLLYIVYLLRFAKTSVSFYECSLYVRWRRRVRTMGNTLSSEAHCYIGGIIQK